MSPALSDHLSPLDTIALPASQPEPRHTRASGSLRNRVREVCEVSVPDIRQSYTYGLRYYWSAARSMIRNHRLVVPPVDRHYRSHLRLDQPDLDRWRAVFGAQAGPARETPFTLQTIRGTSVLIRILAEWGLSLHQVMHLRSELSTRGGSPWKAGERYTQQSSVEDVAPLADDRASLSIVTRVWDSDGFLAATLVDSFFALNLPRKDIDELRRIRGAHLPDQSLDELSRRTARIKGRYERTKIEIPTNFGVTFGRVSGDPNGMHTTRLGAKIFGHERPFLQGFCTLNLCLKALTEARGRTLQSCSIQFIRKAYTGQTMELRHNASRYELRGEDGKLIANGEFATCATTRSGFVHAESPTWPSVRMLSTAI